MKRITPPTAKQLIFFENFDTGAEDWTKEAQRAGKKAGYRACDIRKMMKSPKIIREIKYREEYGMSEVEKHRRDRIDFWRTIMGDVQCEAKDRLRASELWGKHEGDFVHRIDANVKVAQDLEEKLCKALEEENGAD